MADETKIGTKIQLDGEKEYKEAIASISQSLGALGGEMKVVSATYSDNSTSVEALTKKGEILDKQLVEQRKKVDTLRAAHANAAEKLGENDKATQEWTKKLNIAQAALIKAEKAVSSNNVSLGDAKDAMDRYGLSVADVAQDVAGEMGARIDTLNSQLKLNAARYKDDADSVEGLTKTGDILKAQLKTQKAYVDELSYALKKSSERNGENDKTTQKLTKQLVNAQTAVESTTAAITENSEQLVEAQKYQDTFGMSQSALAEKAGRLGDSLQGVADKLGIALPERAKKAVDALNTVDAATVGLLGAAYKMVKGLVNCGFEAAKTADQLITLSAQTGVSTDHLQEWQYASQLVDVSVDVLADSMSQMVGTMRDAKSGSGDMAEAYKTLKVEVTKSNGDLRDSQTVFYELLTALSKVKNETERNAIAMQIFGESARRLNPMIEAGGAKLNALAKEAHETGYVLDKETVASLGQLDDKMQKINLQMETVSAQLGVTIMPILQGLTNIISSINPKLLAAIVIVATAITIILAVARGITAINAAMTILDLSAWKVVAVILAIIAGLTILVALINVLLGKSDDIVRVTSNVANNAGKAAQNAMQTASQAKPKYASGTNFHLGGWATVGENGPEDVWMPRGSQVFTAQETRRRGGDTIVLNVSANDIKQINDIYRIVSTERVSRRMGYGR